jgi:hypothetical protein
MTTKHTPGPWVIGKRDHDVVMVDTASGTAICDVYGESDDRPANARLIAAAPDLLAALEDIARGDYSDPLCMKTPEDKSITTPET